MKKAVAISVIITLSAVTIFVTLLILLVLRVQVLVPHLDAALVSIQAIETNTTRTEAELAGLLNTTRHIAEGAQKQEDMQFAMMQKLTTQATVLLGDADVAVKNLGNVAPDLSDAIKLTSVNLNGVLIGSQQAMQAATDDLANPDIKGTLDNIKESTDNIRVATQEASATLVTVHKGVDYEIAELMKPVKKVKVALLFIASAAGKFFGY